MEKIWLSSYPAGVPAEIDPTRYRSVTQIFEESFAKFADRKAYVCMGKNLTYGEIDRLSKVFGAWLQQTGMPKGARVAVMMPNVLQYPVAIAAVLRAGYTVVNVNPLYTPRELEHQLKDSGAEAIVVLENFAHTVEAVIGNTALKHVVVADMGELLGLKGPLVNFVVRRVKKMVPDFSLPQSITFKQALARAAHIELKPVAQEPGDIAFLQYTGGTTGVAKGAALSHRNIIANVLQSEAWLMPGIEDGLQAEQLVFVCALPLYHIFALTVCCLLGTRRGVLNVLITNPRDIPGLVKELAKHKVSTAGGQYAIQRDAEQPRFRQTGLLHLSLLRGRRHGGAEGRRRPLDESDRLSDHRRLRPVGNLAGGQRQSDRHHRIYRHHRLAGAVHRDRDSGRRRAAGAARAAR